MAGPPTEVQHPSPRALRTIRGVRAQLVQLFREGKAGLIEPALLGRLAHILNVIQALDQGSGAVQRLDELEARLALAKTNGHASGHDSHGRRL